MAYGRCSGTEKRRRDVLGLKGRLGYLPQAPLQPTGNQRASTACPTGGGEGVLGGQPGDWVPEREARAILWCERAPGQPRVTKRCRMWSDGTHPQASGPQTREGLPCSKPHLPPRYRASACEWPSSHHRDTTKLKTRATREYSMDHWSATGPGPPQESPQHDTAPQLHPLQTIHYLLRQLGFDFLLEPPEEKGPQHFVETTNDENCLLLVQVHLAPP